MASSTNPDLDHQHDLNQPQGGSPQGHHGDAEAFQDHESYAPRRIHKDGEWQEKASSTLGAFQRRASAATERRTTSRSSNRALESRFADDLELLRAERSVSNQEHDVAEGHSKTRVLDEDQEDAFNPIVHKEEKTSKRNKNTKICKLWASVKKFPRFVRYIVCLVPGALAILIPTLIGKYSKDNIFVGDKRGVDLMWLGIWIEIMWCSAWISRMITCLMPQVFHGIASLLGAVSAKRWRDMGVRLEVHTAVFLWFLAILISFESINNHREEKLDGEDPENYWVEIVNKVVIALFVLSTLNFVEKLLMQWISTSFHERTYSTRIENSKADVAHLVRLYEYAKDKLGETGQHELGKSNRTGTGGQSSMANFQEGARNVLSKLAHIVHKIANDLIGRKVNTDFAHKVVSELLRDTPSALSLARLIYRSLVREDRENVDAEDMSAVFATKKEADAAFAVFDRNFNGDVSMEEFEAVCNDIHLEKKAIAASLKDLDSVVEKLDKVFIFIIIIISAIVFVAIYSKATAAGLASVSTAVLGFAWVLQATAQEFLQSIIFVFVKHPFDVGDRVTIYGSTGATMRGDDYYVTEISLLYTEFKKLQGHIVQAPNSILNTLFILNQRRSNGISDAIPLEFKFGTPTWMIDELKARMLEFCLANKRDYQPTVIAEMTGVEDVRACKMKIVFMHKSNFQNELLRLNRRNRFVTELLSQMEQIGIETPLRVDPGGSKEHPLYYAGSSPPADVNSKQQSDDDPAMTAQAPAPTRSSMQRLHSHSTRGSRSSISTEEAIVRFQDVFETRRENAQDRRLKSIWEKEEGSRSRDVDEERQVSTTGAALSPTQSIESTSRARFFDRYRRRAKTLQTHPRPDMV
ncbi:hypothetical protein UVI_02043940 [Ustilaginoidea virens]|uniref:Mechanosensitive ion channel protein n=1 Tax=Ustilaginoidea virens TaxID=1159556 RepID=A0A1B5L4D6_USTVR|nr:hypothetical protein UVI_02043940 [Ustilaginoidea virens]